jgi:hypothetical protein
MRWCCQVIPAIALIMVLAGCASSSPRSAPAPRGLLSVAFVDAAWDGREIPVDGRCRECGGRGRSPALVVEGVPADAEDLIVEFNDLRIRDLARNGGHGTLAVATGGATRVTVPSVAEETMRLPAGVRSVRPHRCVFYGHKAGAFKAPCGCGQGNRYAATVKAVRRQGDREVVLASADVLLGVF